MTQYHHRALPDGTVLTPDMQEMYAKWAAFAHNVGSERAHSGEAPEWMEDSLDSMGGLLFDFLPPTHAFTAWDKLLEYARRAEETHDGHPDLCDPCTRQWLAELDDEWERSGLNADLYDVLAGVAP